MGTTVSAGGLTVFPDTKFHGANMALSAPDGSHVGPMNPAVSVVAGMYAGNDMEKFRFRLDRNLYDLDLIRSFIKKWEKNRHIIAEASR